MGGTCRLAPTRVWSAPGEGVLCCLTAGTAVYVCRRRVLYVWAAVQQQKGPHLAALRPAYATLPAARPLLSCVTVGYIARGGLQLRLGVVDEIQRLGVRRLADELLRRVWRTTSGSRWPALVPRHAVAATTQLLFLAEGGNYALTAPGGRDVREAILQAAASGRGSSAAAALEAVGADPLRLTGRPARQLGALLTAIKLARITAARVQRCAAEEDGGAAGGVAWGARSAAAPAAGAPAAAPAVDEDDVCHVLLLLAHSNYALARPMHFGVPPLAEEQVRMAVNSVARLAMCTIRHGVLCHRVEHGCAYVRVCVRTLRAHTHEFPRPFLARTLC